MYKHIILYLIAGIQILFSCKISPRYMADYDDGSTIFINVKIAIDEEGWNSQTSEFFKEKLEKQWGMINTRFNNCDRKKELKRHYIFKPDLNDIIIYEGSSYWGENGADTKVINRMDTGIFKLVVVYDFFYNGEENGEYGGGCGNKDGIGTILVINASEKMKNKSNNHFDQYTYRAITHELGHFRGVTDLYVDIVEAENNPVNGEAFHAEHCLMNDFCYTPDEESYWSDYAIKVINKSGNNKVPDLIHRMMYDDFAEKMNITATENGEPAQVTVKLYPAKYSYETWSNVIQENETYSFDIKGTHMVEDLKSLFFDEAAGGFARFLIFLAEATTAKGEKKYVWIADYMMHECGMDGNDTYTLNFEF